MCLKIVDTKHGMGKMIMNHDEPWNLKVFLGPWNFKQANLVQRERPGGIWGVQQAGSSGMLRRHLGLFLQPQKNKNWMDNDYGTMVKEPQCMEMHIIISKYTAGGLLWVRLKFFEYVWAKIWNRWWFTAEKQEGTYQEVYVIPYAFQSSRIVSLDAWWCFAFVWIRFSNPKDQKSMIASSCWGSISTSTLSELATLF